MSVMTRLPDVPDRKTSNFNETLDMALDRIDELKAALLAASPSNPNDSLRMMNDAAECINLLLEAVANERERCIAVCEGWIGKFQESEIKRTSAREYTVDAIEDIIAEIREGHDPSVIDKGTSE